MFKVLLSLLCVRKGIQHDLKIFKAKRLSSILGFSSTRMQPITDRKLSYGLIVE